MKKIKGFTLIEVLSVVAILAIISVITVPVVLEAIETARKGAVKASTENYINAVEYHIASSYSDNDPINDIPLTGNFNDANLEVKGTKPTGVNVYTIEGVVNSGAISYEDYSAIITGGQVVDITKNDLSLILIGDSVIDHNLNEAYTDAGATAYDLIEGDLTNAITVSGTVDINQLGSYTLTYYVENSQGISASKTRTVNVIDKTVPVITITGDNPYVLAVGTAYS